MWERLHVNFVDNDDGSVTISLKWLVSKVIHTCHPFLLFDGWIPSIKWGYCVSVPEKVNL